MTDAPQSAGLVALADRIELWPIEKLRPYERNPRARSEGQVDQIAASMVEFGWTNPILVDEQGGVLAGHGRLLAARKLGLAEAHHRPPTTASPGGDCCTGRVWEIGAAIRRALPP